MKQSSTSFSPASNKAPHSKVSKKFHAYIRGRVCEACAVYGQPTLSAVASDMIDSYIADGVVPPVGSDAVCMMIFTILRPEIDRAKERSASARRRAAVRRGGSAVIEKVPDVTADRMTSDCNDEEVSVCSDDGEPDCSSISFPNRRARRLFMNDMKRRARTRIKPLNAAG